MSGKIMGRITLLLGISILLTGCFPRNGVGRELFDNNDCSAPCILGITPGMTSEVDAKNIIYSNRLFMDCHEYDYTPQGGIRGIECDSISLVYEQDFVAQVGFSLNDVSLEEFINKYDPPNRLAVIIGSSPEAPRKVKAGLWFDNIYTQVTLPEIEGESYEISQHLQIESITYYSEDRYNRIIMDMLNIELWKGYMVYLGKLP